MKFQLLLATFIIYSVSSSTAQETNRAPNTQNLTPKAVSEKPLYLQPFDPTATDFGIADKMARSDKAEGSADRHYEKGMLYKRAGNHLYNQSRYKQAYQFYLQAEAELQQAAEKHEKALPKDADFTIPDSPFAIQRRQAVAAYYHLGLVSERIRNDKSVAAECFAKARELDPSANHLASKLARTKEGRERLGVKSPQDFKRRIGPKEDRDAIDEGTEEQPAFKDGNGK